MSQLKQLQENFQSYLMNDNKAIIASIVNDKKVGAAARLNIYYNAYRLRIIEALATSYPKLNTWLGDQLFNQIARSYINHYPSTFSNMRWVGDKMSHHLQNHLTDMPIAAEMAQFEWAIGLAFDAEDAPILQLADLAAIAPEEWGNLQFSFHPSMQLLPTQYNVIAIWNALDSDDAKPSPTLINHHIVVWRQDLDSHFRSISHTEYAAIQLMANSENFATLCESLQTNYQENASLTAAQFLSTWLNDGLIEKVT